MGAAASTDDLKTQLQTASKDDLCKLLSSLPPDNVAKLERAVDNVALPKEELAASKDRSSWMSLPVFAAMKKESAPFLHQFFQKMTDISKAEAKKALEDPASMAAIALDPKKKEEHDAKTMEEHAPVLLPLIEKSFDHHDRSKNGVLDVEESAVFFKNLVSENTEFMAAITEWSIKTMVDFQFKQMADMIQAMGGPEKLKEAKKEASEKVDQMLKSQQNIIRALEKEYLDAKQERDGATFKVLDVNEDGKLQKTEVVEAFTPSSAKYKAMMSALGFDEKEMETRMTAAAMADAEALGAADMKAGGDECTIM